MPKQQVLSPETSDINVLTTANTPDLFKSPSTEITLSEPVKNITALSNEVSIEFEPTPTDKTSNLKSTSPTYKNIWDRIRDGFEIKPMTGKNSFSQEDIKVLNDENTLKQNQYGRVCPECQDTYKKNSMRSREITPYRDENSRVEISS